MKNIFLQGDMKNNNAKRKLGIVDNTIITVEPTKRAKDNEFVFFEKEDGRIGFKRYKKVKHLECEVYAIVDIWNHNTEKILKKLYRSKR